MPKKVTEQVNVKYPTGLLNKIDSDIAESGEFRNRSEWIIAAARFYLDHREKMKEPDFVPTSSEQNIQCD